MTTRILPPNEWPRLNGTEAEQLWPRLPLTAHVVVVEDGLDIVGCWTLMPILHVECLYIAPSHRRRSSVGRRLWRGMCELVHQLGSQAVWTAAMSDDIRQLLDHAGAVKVAGDHYVMPMPPGRM
jgi:hypothetical protein